MQSWTQPSHVRNSLLCLNKTKTGIVVQTFSRFQVSPYSDEECLSNVPQWAFSPSLCFNISAAIWEVMAAEKSRSRWDPEREPTQQLQASHQLKQCSSNCEGTAVFSVTTRLGGLLLFSLTKRLFIIKWGRCQMLMLHPSKQRGRERDTHTSPQTHTHTNGPWPAKVNSTAPLQRWQTFTKASVRLPEYTWEYRPTGKRMHRGQLNIYRPAILNR